MSDAPHHQAAFINAIHEEGTKAEAVKYLQETWNELCEARARIRELEAAQGVAVKDGVLERIVWSAMVWARENPSPDEVPEYTDGGNSFAEKECRAAVQRIRSALTPADAIAAREARDKQVRERALREAMQIYRKNACDEQRSEAEILALIEKDTPNDG